MPLYYFKWLLHDTHPSCSFSRSKFIPREGGQVPFRGLICEIDNFDALGQILTLNTMTSIIGS